MGIFFSNHFMEGILMNTSKHNFVEKAKMSSVMKE